MKNLFKRPLEVFLLMLTSTLLGCDTAVLIGIHHYHIMKATIDVDFVTIFIPVVIVIFLILHFLIRSIKNKPHECTNGTPIVVLYQTFESRKVIYQCKCGKRYLRKNIHQSYIFYNTNLQTILLSKGEIDDVLQNKESEYIKYLINSGRRK